MSSITSDISLAIISYSSTSSSVTPLSTYSARISLGVTGSSVSMQSFSPPICRNSAISPSSISSLSAMTGLSFVLSPLPISSNSCPFLFLTAARRLFLNFLRNSANRISSIPSLQNLSNKVRNRKESFLLKISLISAAIIFSNRRRRFAKTANSSSDAFSFKYRQSAFGCFFQSSK